jgi:hypothetical protein
MEICERKEQTFKYSSIIFQFIQCIIYLSVKFLHIVIYSAVAVNYFRSFYDAFNFDGSILHWTAHIPNYQLTILKYKLLSVINNAISQIIDQLSVPTSVTYL